MSRDIHAFEIPLLPGATDSAVTASLLRETGPFVWLSPGMVMACAIALGAIVAVVRPKRFHWAAGLLFCCTVANLSSVTLNHPELIARLDQQFQQRLELDLVLKGTTIPPIDSVLMSRVMDWVGAGHERGSWKNGLNYLRYGGSMLMLTAAGLLLAMNGRLSRRLGQLGLWSLVAFGLAVGVSFDRIKAEWHWQHATEADARAQTETAEREAEAALAQFPQLAALERTGLFLGKLDYRVGDSTSLRAYFEAVQRIGNGEFVRGAAEAEALVRSGQPAPDAKRWLAAMVARQAFSRFEQGNVHGAEDLWRRSFAMDPTQIFRPLFAIAVRARAERSDPDAIAGVVEPLLPVMEDRVMRGALLAMLGDVYFGSGRFVEARDRYRRAIVAYSLPKHINYRAQRGMTGM